jgi:hypothetical protein
MSVSPTSQNVLHVGTKGRAAAAAAPTDSVEPVREAFAFALDAIRAAGRSALLELLEADFEAATRRASCCSAESPRLRP